MAETNASMIQPARSVSIAADNASSDGGASTSSMSMTILAITGSAETDSATPQKST